MKHYMIKYRIGTSEVERYTVWCSEDELEENLENLLYHFEAFIDWIGDKPEGQKDYYETNKINILKEFGLLDKNEENENKIYRMWRY